MVKLLIADDEDLECRSLHLFFENNFPEITLLEDAKNGADVIEAVFHQKPDILILDIEMPGLNGLEALQILRQSNSLVHVIIKTAYSKFDYARDAINLHVDYYLLKPVKKEELRKCVAALLSKIPEQTQDHQSAIGIESPITQIGLLSSVLHRWTDSKEANEYAHSIHLNFSCGFILLIALRGFASVVNADLMTYIRQLMATVSDFILGTIENDTIPLRIYYEKPVSSAQALEAGKKLGYMLRERIQEKYAFTPIICSGSLVRDDIALLYDSFQEALSLLKPQPSLSLTETSQNPQIQKALTYIREHYNEDLPLEKISEQLRMNPSYFSHLFKESMKQSYIDYLNEYRISQAIRLLRENPLSINELSERVGFLYPSYFCKIFKRYTGVTITEFKKEL